MPLLRRLPTLRVDSWEWQAEAACRGMEPAAFFHPDNERGPSRARRERTAKAVCARCTVSDACLRWALAAREPFGIWGGTSAEEREALLTQRPA